MKPIIRNSLIGLVVLAALAAFFMLSSGNKEMPEIGFTDIDGQPHQLADFKGKPVLVVFWATDCPGCIQEMPELVALYHEYTNTNLNMIAIAMPHDRPDHIQAMRKQKHLPYLITWDSTGALSQAFDNVRVTPTHFLISPEGEIVMRKIGNLRSEQLKQRLALMGVTANKS